MIKEKKDNNILIQIKSDITNYNIEFWNKFTVNDIKDGLNKLIEFYIYKNLIYNQNMQQINGSINEILKKSIKLLYSMCKSKSRRYIYKIA